MLLVRTKGYLRRRYYRVLAKMQSVGASIEIAEQPHEEVITGSMYRMKMRITNRSKITWNPAGSRDPVFSIAGYIPGYEDLEFPHTLIPVDFHPGSTIEIPLLFEVPRFPCDITLRTDIVRENCYWLSELGNQSPEISLSVVSHSDPLMESLVPAVDVTLDVTNKCPLKCIQCRKTYFETFDEQQDMNFPLFEKIAKEVFPYARSVSLSSAGEPLMTRNFMDAVELSRQYGLDVSFITSGMHLDHNRAEKLVELGVSRVEFSIDGASAEVYNKIRIGSNYDKVIKNISYLNEVKRRKQSNAPLMRFNFVLMKSNIHELPDLIRLAHRLGIEEVQTQHMVVFIDQLKDEALIFDKERSNRYVTEAKSLAERYGIRFYHPPLFTVGTKEDRRPESTIDPQDGKIWVKADDFDFERVTHPNVPDGMLACTDPWRKIFIDWRGMVYPCCVWKEDPLGDLTKNTFVEVWNSEPYRNLRRGLTAGPLGKSCASCSVITGGDVDSERSYFFSS